MIKDEPRVPETRDSFYSVDRMFPGCESLWDAIAYLTKMHSDARHGGRECDCPVDYDIDDLERT